MAQQTATPNLQEGMYGSDGRAEFKIVEVNRSDVLIEYVSDRKQTRLQPNRFVLQNGSLRVA